jgi:small subunit ribosomal protein S9
MAEINTLEDLKGAMGAETEADAAPKRERVRDALGRSYATGKRKDAVARVWI